MRRTIPVVAVALAVLGGAYFGLFSCGGYRGEREAFSAGLLGCLTLTSVFPPRALFPKARRVAFVAGVLTTFLIFRAALASCYPALPASWTAFAQTTWANLCIRSVSPVADGSSRLV